MDWVAGFGLKVLWKIIPQPNGGREKGIEVGIGLRFWEGSFAL